MKELITDYSNELKRLERFINLSSRGFVLCRIKEENIYNIVNNFNKSILKIDLNEIEGGAGNLQFKILETLIALEHIKSIIFIYGFNSQNRKDYENLNITRDVFSKYNAVFIFLMSKQSEKKMINYAFDFYDWMKAFFIFDN